MSSLCSRELTHFQASVPAFTALLQTFALDQRLPTTVWASLIPVVGGLTLATKTEVNFDLVGFIVCLLAAALTCTFPHQYFIPEVSRHRVQLY